MKPVQNGPKRILVIDDDPTVGQVFKEYFRNFNHGHTYEVITATDGLEAVRKALFTPPDLVVVDLVMPKMGGLEFIRHLRAVGERVPVIVMTGRADLTETTAALRQEIFAYMRKPVPFAYIEHLVALALPARLTLSSHATSD